MLDDDDEVRDRAGFYHYVLSSGDRALIKEYILNEELRLNTQALERALLAYVAGSAADHARPLDLTSLPIEEPLEPGQSAVTAMADSSTVGYFDASSAATSATAEKGFC